MNAAPPTNNAAAAQVPGSGMGSVGEMLQEADLTNDKFAGVGNFPAGRVAHPPEHKRRRSVSRDGDLAPIGPKAAPLLDDASVAV